MATITLLTDFGHQDAYVGVMKGVINIIDPSAHVIDLCHEVPPQDIHEAGYLLASSYQYFAVGSIHVVVVDPGVGSGRRAIAARIAGHYFVLPDNGLLSHIVAKHEIESVVSLTNSTFFRKPVSNTFHGRDIFAPVAAHLSLGVPMKSLGPSISDPIIEPIPHPVKEKSTVTGRVIHVDRFGNIITNITGRDVPEHNSLIVRFGIHELRGLKRSYADVKRGEPLAIIGSFGNLEISIAQGNAAESLQVKVGDEVEVNAQ